MFQTNLIFLAQDGSLQSISVHLSCHILPSRSAKDSQPGMQANIDSGVFKGESGG